MRLLFILLFASLFLLPNSSSCQSPYLLQSKRDPIILAGGAAIWGTSLWIERTVDPFSQEELELLDRSEVNSFDVDVTYNYSTSAANISDALVIGAFATPLSLLAAKKSRKHFGHIGMLYAETILLTAGITNLTKVLVKRTRPLVYNEEASLSDKTNHKARLSFFSGHTSIATAGSFFTASVFSDFFPDSKFKPYVWAAAVTLPAVVGGLRVASGKHYYTDVIAGYIVGGGNWLVNTEIA